MRHPVSITPHTQQCPRLRIRIRLPLATVEELDYLAQLAHGTRQQILRQLISALATLPFAQTGPTP